MWQTRPTHTIASQSSLAMQLTSTSWCDLLVLCNPSWHMVIFVTCTSLTISSSSNSTSLWSGSIALTMHALQSALYAQHTLCRGPHRRWTCTPSWLRTSNAMSRLRLLIKPRSGRFAPQLGHMFQHACRVQTWISFVRRHGLLL